MPLTAGTRLGSYEIAGALGAGGMGEVYRARDTKLGRDVAIKILPESVVNDPERVARFQREAQVLAALNHPHIAAIYGLEDAGPTRFIVMELVDGESLADRLARAEARGLLVEDALAIARQIVDALEAAHDKGIVHRDLKPANIMLTADGQVKVLDFGLAKIEPGESGGSGGPAGLTHSPTLTFAATQAGMILGTAAYMSPEQARGRAADKRSDVWAFGCVLYEMLTGKRAFDGEDATDVIAAVVRAEPDWSALPSTVPPTIRAIVQRCLTKDRKSRVPDMAVVRFMMADVDTVQPGPARADARGPRGRPVLLAGAAAVTAAVLAASGTWWAVRAGPAAPPRPAHFTLVTSSGLPIGVGNPDRAIVITPDGAHIVSINGTAIGGGGQLMVRNLGQLEPVPIKGVTTARAPFVSPDSRWIGYFSDGYLKKVPIAGGAPTTICRISGGTRGSTWGPDNTIVYASNDSTTGLAIVPAGGGEPRILTKPDTAHGEVDHFFPAFLPGGRRVLFTITTSSSIDNASIAVLDLKTGERKILIHGGTSAEYVSSGHLLYASVGSLRAVHFDPERLEILGDPVVVVDQIRTEPSGAAHFSASADGSLVYVSGGGGNFEDRALVWVDRHGREQPIEAPVRGYLHPRLSPDGSRVAVAIADQEQDIWIFDLRGRRLTRLTFGPSVEQYPLWSPDGARVIFRSDRGGIPDVFSQAADGSGRMENVTAIGGAQQRLLVPYTLTPDGKALILGTGTHLGIARLENPANNVETVVTAEGVQSNAAISPDGRWLAYSSTESGPSQIYVRPFPRVDAGHWQVSTTDGNKPLWSRSGRELFYSAADGSLMAARVQTNGGTFAVENPTKLFDLRPYYLAPAGRTFDVSGDDQKFLMIKQAQGEQSAPLASAVIILNWFEELRQRAGAK